MNYIKYIPETGPDVAFAHSAMLKYSIIPTQPFETKESIHAYDSFIEAYRLKLAKSPKSNNNTTKKEISKFLMKETPSLYTTYIDLCKYNKDGNKINDPMPLLKKFRDSLATDEHVTIPDPPIIQELRLILCKE